MRLQEDITLNKRRGHNIAQERRKFNYTRKMNIINNKKNYIAEDIIPDHNRN